MAPAPAFARPLAFLILLLALAGPGLPRAAHAQAKPSQTQIDHGRQLCDQADQLLAAGKAAEALKLYQEVLKALPASPRARRGAAACRAALGRTAAPARATTIRGTGNFGGTETTWSAVLTPKGNGTYKAVYISKWGGTPLHYVGTIRTDRRTRISGEGRPSGGGANGTFRFSGRYGGDGIAQCSYSEVGGARNGTLTAELPR